INSKELIPAAWFLGLAGTWVRLPTFFSFLLLKFDFLLSQKFAFQPGRAYRGKGLQVLAKSLPAEPGFANFLAR
ncbi:MAG: hypothetical protein IJ744_06890, partial [Lachnospiraceae bacterium]|nr:hypothetical protein [Lachnospiraceae bacterium]